jgi:FkbM family methyltransferase
MATIIALLGLDEASQKGLERQDRRRSPGPLRCPPLSAILNSPMAIDHATITIAGLHMTLIGAPASYIHGFHGYDADRSALAAVPRQTVLLDVGANIGITTIIMAVLRPSCRIIAFEPVPSNRDFLRRNLDANHIENVEIDASAISDRHGTVRLTDNGPWSLVSASAALECPCRPLDDFTDLPVSFVKVDTEGFEPSVFSGARRLFAERRPLIFTEFNAWTLLLQRHDPLAFAETIYRSFHIIGVFAGDHPEDRPNDPHSFVHMNMVLHRCVTDILISPRDETPKEHEPGPA